MKMRVWFGPAQLLAFAILQIAFAENNSVPPGTPPEWHTSTPRAEISPQFAYEKSGGRDDQRCLVLHSRGSDGEDGCWVRSYPVSVGNAYRFSVLYQSEGVPVPRRS